ncbi:uncharacterized protein Z519_10092 [Cladophialophora bantiana CBS 173.52]|uniref:C2H2-type domain-containing protein n=1 Tax=Cladophialophora bantiana (strain ATCC 10958 / CBS 173.52 / CDC B-1940 / NIH 8579) TaxID=1442370 RepID=A0A0D2HXA1_CLAB1|nr:uncharacterized protein Z519_10092 [Cladophialophora bantiana CBS 173.52]KIW89239.1 hypothetical protein Z519_10092 [Cladophialophora bantiana CBS 173.52]
MSPSARVYCPICRKTYSRLDHLQRHLANHAPWRPFVCGTCSKAFKRKDVLRRHSIMCHAPPRDGNDLRSAPAKVRTNRTACDRCARLKRACDSMRPCRNCAEKKETCSYTWLQDHTPEIDLEHALEAGHERDCSTLSTSLPFPYTSALQATWPEDRTEPQSPPDDFRTHTYLPPGSLDPASDDMESSWAVTDGLSPDNDFSTLALGTDFVERERDPRESFSFLIRFTRNDEGMGGAFAIDTEALREILPEPSLSEKDSDGLSEVAEYGGSLPFNNRYLPEGRQIFPHGGWDHLADTVSATNPGRPVQLPLESFATSQWVELSTGQNASFEGLRSNSTRGSHSLTRSSTDCESKYRHLSIKSHQIFTAIKKMSLSGQGVESINRTGADDWSPFLERECVDFFRPANLHRFHEYFWTLWYPNCPTIHKPSFDATTAPHQLLAAMALIGASLSPYASDHSRAKLWFDVVEKLVFYDERTYNVDEGSCIPCFPDQLEARLRALQAAYAVCLYQNWEGGDAAKGRIRRQRYSMVISVARDLMRYANHVRLDCLDPHTFSWKDFVVKEEVIRSIMYVFLLDTAFTIFNNFPPRMVLREATNDLACPEPCFQASTALDCFNKIQKWISHPLYKKGIPFHAAVRSLRQKTLDAGTKAYLSQCGVLNLWTIVSSFHSFLFNIDPVFGSDAQFETLRNAIINWRVVWNLRFEPDFVDCYGTHDLWAPQCMTEPDTPWKRIGFYRNASEYWLLARVMLEKVESFRKTDEAEHSPLECKDSRGTGVPLILSKFDETSMDQVNDLITSFQPLRMSE